MRFIQAWFLAAIAAVPFVAATIDNSDAYDAIHDAAVQLIEGDYTLTNVKTGQTIQYVAEGRQFFPDKGDASAIQFTANSDGPYMRIGAGGKCLSAQWGYDEEAPGVGADHAGVLYGCAVGDDANPHSTVEHDKQWWLLVPVDEDAVTSNLEQDPVLSSSAAAAPTSTSSSVVVSSTPAVTSSSAPTSAPIVPSASASASASVSAPVVDEAVPLRADFETSDDCQKSQDWIQRHPLYVNGPDYQHTECASFLREDQKVALGLSGTYSRRLSAAFWRRNRMLTQELSRRGPSSVNGGTFYIITLDHLDDMATRALASKSQKIEGDMATVLDVFDEGNALQQWVLTAAS